MKAFKKLMAVLLSVMMLLGMVIIPTAAEEVSAEETVTKTYDLLDLSDAALGTVEGTSYPDGVSEIAFDVPQHTGEKQVVENADGKKVLQLDLSDFTFDTSVGGKVERIFSRGSATGYNEAYSILAANIPAAHIPYISSINLKLKKSEDSDSRIAFEYGVTDGSNWSRVDGYANQYVWDKGTNEFSFNPDSLHKVAKWKVQQYSNTIDSAAGWDDTFTGIFLTLTAYTAVTGGNAGTLEIEEMSYTVTTTESVMATFPVAKKFNVLDLTDAAVGDYATGAVPYPAGVSEFNLNGTTQYAETTSVVANSEGKKALRFDLSKFTLTNSASYNNLAGAGYNQVYAIHLNNVNETHIPYITSVNIRMRKSADSDAAIAYELGVTDGTYYSKVGNQNRTVAADTKGGIAASYDPATLYKGKVWNVSYNWSATGSWNKDFTGMFFTFAAYTAEGATAGTLDIEEISYTCSATAEEWANMPITKTIDMLDLSDVELGDFATTSYPVGGSEFRFPTGRSTATTMYDGDRKVVTNADGKKVLQLNLDGLTYNTASSFVNRLSQAAYTPVYAVKLTDIPATYAPYLGNINLKLKKSDDSEARVVYEFGMTDGVLYSKKTANNNQAMEVGTQEINISYGRSELTQTTAWKLGWDQTNSGTNWVDKAYTGIFLAIGAYTEEGKTAGTITIEEMSYTVTATEAELAAADAEWEKIKYRVNDFESDSTAIETEFAAGGAKALEVTSKDKTININNPYFQLADGISFWVYNPSNVTRSFKIKLGTADSSVKYVRAANDKIPAKSYRKIEFDFNCIYTDHNTGNPAGWYVGENVCLTPAERAAITTIEIRNRTMVDGAYAPYYVDDIYLSDTLKLKEETDVVLDAETVTGATLNADGKFVIPASAEDQTVEISVPKGSMTNASNITFNLTSNASADVSLRLYANATLDANRENGGEPAYIKAGAQPWQFTLYNREVTLSVDSSTVTEFRNTISQKMFFSDPVNTWKAAIKYEHTGIFAQTDTVQFDSWTKHNLPTPTEKASIDTLYVNVKAFGDPTNADDYITLDSIEFESQGVTINTPKVTENTVDGAVSTITQPIGFEGQTYGRLSGPALNVGKSFPGKTAMVYVNAYDGYYLDSIAAVDNLGNTVALTQVVPTDGANVGVFYSFEVPTADVTIEPVFKKLKGTLISEIGYDDSSFELSYVTPVVAGQVYNEDSGDLENLVDCGVIVVGYDALEKYGLTEEDLTRENVEMWKETGHNIANYIFEMDEEDIIGDMKDGVSKHIIHFTDITPEMRRNVYVYVAKYANFTNNAGESTVPVNQTIVNTFDGLVYGDSFVPEFNSYRGVNYTSTSTNIEYMQELAGLGYDHIRLVRRANASWDYGLDENGNFTEAYLQKTDKIIENALKCGLSVVLDLHSLANINGDFENNADAYRNAWAVLGERYAAYPESVVFELINEPRTDIADDEDYDPVANPDPMTIEELNTLQCELIDSIRSFEGNENRKVVIGNNWNAAWDIETSFTEELLNKGNLIVDFHYYSPMDFSHSGQGEYIAGATDWGDTTLMDKKFAEMNALAENYGVGIWIGEWGAYQAEYNAKLAYYEAMVSKMYEYGISWAVWASTDSWSGWDSATNSWDNNILAILFAEQE